MNWIKMYDKAGSVLRVETVINQPEAFKVRKRVRRKGRRVTQWVPMRKGVANLFRYRDVSLAANARYLEALAVVDDPSAALTQLDALTRRKRTRAGQSVKAFNPLSADEQRIYKALLSGAKHHQRLPQWGSTRTPHRESLPAFLWSLCDQAIRQDIPVTQTPPHL